MPTNSGMMTVKVLVQRSNSKLLFAHAEEDFIDFLFGFLTIPLGTALFILSGNTSLGSIDNLYKSVENLNVDRYMKSEDPRDTLLYPEMAQQSLCKNQIFALREAITRFYRYTNMENNEQSYGYDKPLSGIIPPHVMEKCCTLTFKDPKFQGGFVRGPAMYMVTSDLAVTPSPPISSFNFLNRLKVPLSDVEEQEVSIGMDEGLSILRASLNSSSALTHGLNFLLKKPKQEH